MEVQRKIRLGMGALLTVVVVACLGAIGLFTRMGPAIERILADNEYSVEAAEQMLGVLAGSVCAPPPEGARQQFLAALERARHNITEQDETTALDAIEPLLDGALAGDPVARQGVIAALGQFTAANRQAMRRADDEAKRLGVAGAWAMVLLGLVGFGSGLLVAARLRQRLLEPVAELNGVLAAVAAGDRHRRCSVAAGSAELGAILRGVNELLDARERPVPDEGAVRAAEASRDRALLHHLLDASEVPRLVVDGRGEVIVASREALDRLAGPGGAELREALSAVVDGRAAAAVRQVARVERADGFVCELAPPRAEPAAGAEHG